MPIAARDDTRLEPPELMKGSAFPAKGSNPTITVMLISASRPIQITRPVASRVPSMSGARRAMTKPRQTSSRVQADQQRAPNSPSSSTMTAKMLSVGGTGRPVSLDVALPMPTPNQPPLTMASKERRT